MNHTKEELELLSLSQELAGLLTHSCPTNKEWVTAVRKAWRRIAEMWTDAQ